MFFFSFYVYSLPLQQSDSDQIVLLHGVLLQKRESEISRVLFIRVGAFGALEWCAWNPFHFHFRILVGAHVIQQHTI